MKLRIDNHLLLFYHYPLRKCCGISSKTENDNHYLLFDIDKNENLNDIQNWFFRNYGNHFAVEPSPNGYHVIVFVAYPFRWAIEKMVDCPFVDLNWVALGIKRGYWFLEWQTPLKEKITYMRVDRLA